MSDILEWAATIGLLLISVLLLLLAGEPSRGKTIAAAKWFWRNLASFLQKHREPLEIVWTIFSGIGVVIGVIVYWTITTTFVATVLAIAGYSLVWLFSSAENRASAEEMLRIIKVGGISLIGVLLLLSITKTGREGIRATMERFWQILSKPFSIAGAVKGVWQGLKTLLSLTFGCTIIIAGFLFVGTAFGLTIYGLFWVITTVIKEVK